MTDFWNIERAYLLREQEAGNKRNTEVREVEQKTESLREEGSFYLKNVHQAFDGAKETLGKYDQLNLLYLIRDAKYLPRNVLQLNSYMVDLKRISDEAKNLVPLLENSVSEYYNYCLEQAKNDEKWRQINAMIHRIALAIITTTLISFLFVVLIMRYIPFMFTPLLFAIGSILATKFGFRKISKGGIGLFSLFIGLSFLGFLVLYGSLIFQHIENRFSIMIMIAILDFSIMVALYILSVFVLSDIEKTSLEEDNDYE